LTRVLRKVWAILAVAVVFLACTAGPAAAAYAPAPGPLFNNPRGNKEARARIIRHIIDAIDHTPRYSTIRIAAYSFDRPDVADALIAANHRDVDVQMVLNDNWTSTQTLRLRRQLGTDPNQRSFVVICKAACRGGAGNQHMKFYLFSKTGTAKDVTMIGSANLTGYGAFVQWNDMFTINNNFDIRDLYTKIFEQLVRDRHVATPYYARTVGGYENHFYPHPDTTPDNDPEMRRLAKVRCTATGGTGHNGHTVIRITMYGWNQDRGLYLADKVADLDRRGCDVRVLLSDGGGKVYRHLKAGGVLVKSADLDLNGNPDDGFEDSGYELFTHEKFMLLSGGYGASTATWNVWTGSENWSNVALINDEVTIRVPYRTAFEKYRSNFDYIWDKWSRWL
jgi:phosphatidylserine/phosphatidylglycerophosphate/cardiolipin synthase-like enzyme